MIGHNKVGKKMIKNYYQLNNYKLNYINIKKLLVLYKNKTYYSCYRKIRQLKTVNLRNINYHGIMNLLIMIY